MQTRVTELLGIEKPVIQGGMAWVADAQLAAAVSNAGGLGLIAAGSASPEWVREQVLTARELTSKPFGINIMLMSPHAAQIAQLAAELKVSAVTTGAGSPTDFIPLWKEAGVKVIPVVASAALARRMERCGADAVVAEGCEAGGHIGENGAGAVCVRGSADPRHRRRRHRRRPRHGGGLLPGCRGRAAGHALPRERRVHRARGLQGQGRLRQGF